MRCAARSVIRRPPQLGQKPRPLQENATNRSVPQPVHRNRANPMREHAAANESLKLALHEQRGAALFVMSVELPEERLEVLAHHAVKHPMLGGATHVRSRYRLARSRGVKLHDHRTPSRLVPLFSPYFFKHVSDRSPWSRSGERGRHAGGRHRRHACGLALLEAPAANKPKALSAASGDWGHLRCLTIPHLAPYKLGSFTATACKPLRHAHDSP